MSPNQASSLFLVAIGGVVMVLASRLGLGNAKHIGPGFLSFWSAAIMSGLGVIVFARELIPAKASGRKRASQLWTDRRWRNPVLILVAVAAYILVFQPLGFILSSTLLLIGLFLVLKPVRFWRDLLIAVVASVAIFAIFDLWLKVTLPHRLPEQLLISLRNLL